MKMENKSVLLRLNDDMDGEDLFYEMNGVQRTCALGLIMRLLDEKKAEFRDYSICTPTGDVIDYGTALNVFHAIFKRLLCSDETYVEELSDEADYTYNSLDRVGRTCAIGLLLRILDECEAEFSHYCIPLPGSEDQILSFKNCLSFAHYLVLYIMELNNIVPEKVM